MEPLKYSIVLRTLYGVPKAACPTLPPVPRGYLSMYHPVEYKYHHGRSRFPSEKSPENGKKTCTKPSRSIASENLDVSGIWPLLNLKLIDDILLHISKIINIPSFRRVKINKGDQNHGFPFIFPFSTKHTSQVLVAWGEIAFCLHVTNLNILTIKILTAKYTSLFFFFLNPYHIKT
jgi:hypothetical protein